jgi:hypothetical protein
VKQNVAGIDLIDHTAGLVDDLDAAMQADLPFAQQSAAKLDGLVPGGFGIRQFLAIAVAAQGSAFTDMEKIAGHAVGFAALFMR